MGRARNIKPGFFINDKLAEIPPLGRLLFAGLWTISDREGRLEYRPKRIKASILPYDDCNIADLITELEKGGFVYTYTVDDKNYLGITNWHKHQSPHHMELPSDVPPPPGKTNKFNHKPITKKQRERIFLRDKQACVKCGSKNDLTIDHITPISAGGTSDDSNLQTLCSSCNKSSSNRQQVDNELMTDDEQVDDESTNSTESRYQIPDTLNLNPDSLKYIDHFERIWALYPQKLGKKKITNSKKRLKEIYDFGYEPMVLAINTYLDEVARKRTNGFETLEYMYGSTFFGPSEPYKDYYERGKEKNVFQRYTGEQAGRFNPYTG